MGELRFILPEDNVVDQQAATTAHVIGLDGIPWPCRATLEENLLVLRRNVDDSGRVFINYPCGRFGRLALCTGTLYERSEPYVLEHELGRGTLNRLRNQLSIWQEGGLSIPTSTLRHVSEATAILASNLLKAKKEQIPIGVRDAILLAVEGIYKLSGEFARQVVQFRLQSTVAQQRPWWGVVVCPETLLQLPAHLHLGFNAFAVNPSSSGIIASRQESSSVKTADVDHAAPARWGSQCRQLGRQAFVGPLINVSASHAPVEDSGEEFDQRRMRIARQVRQLMEGMAPDAVIWAMAGLNGIGHRDWSYPQQLQITIDVIQAIEQVCPQAGVMVSFDQPWGERMAWSVGGTHPLHIADVLMRQGVSMAALGLEINLDYWPHGSLVRDPLQWIDLVDLWAQLGVPVVVLLRAPLSATTAERQPSPAMTKRQRRILGSAEPEQLWELLNVVVPMLIARPSVAGVIWNQWQSSGDPFPGSGLVDSSGNPNDALNQLAELPRRTQLHHLLGLPQVAER